MSRRYTSKHLIIALVYEKQSYTYIDKLKQTGTAGNGPYRNQKTGQAKKKSKSNLLYSQLAKLVVRVGCI